MALEDDVLRELFGSPPAARGRRLVAPKRPIVGSGLTTRDTSRANETGPRMFVVDDGQTGLPQIENEYVEGQYIDEVQAYLAKKQQAAQEVGKDEFYQFVQMQKLNREEIAKIAPYTRQNPPSVVGQVLGGVQTVQPGGPLATCAYWAGEDEETIAVTCTIFPIDEVAATDSTLGKGAWRPFADVTIGMRGAKRTIRVDIGMGCQFTVATPMVQIDVGMLAPASGNAVKQAVLGATLGFRSVTRQRPITCTKYIDSLGSGANTTVFLPIFTKDVTTYFSNTAPTLAYLDAAGNTLYSLVATQGGTQATIPGDVVAIKVTDGGGGGDVRLVCALEL